MGRNLQTDETELSVETCRRLLGGMARGLSDNEVGQLRDQLYSVARVVMTSSTSGDHEPFDEAAAALSEANRIDADERAAICEFDGKLSRDQAERLALSAHLRRPKRA